MVSFVLRACDRWSGSGDGLSELSLIRSRRCVRGEMCSGDETLVEEVASG
jgi:hypothetical protein